MPLKVASRVELRAVIHFLMTKKKKSQNEYLVKKGTGCTIFFKSPAENDMFISKNLKSTWEGSMRNVPRVIFTPQKKNILSKNYGKIYLQH